MHPSPPSSSASSSPSSSPSSSRRRLRRRLRRRPLSGLTGSLAAELLGLRICIVTSMAPLRPSTVAELAAGGVAVPADLAFAPGMGLSAALSRFAFTLSLLRDPASVTRVAAELCEDAAAEGVTTLEIRFAAATRGPGIEAIIDAALAGIDGAQG